MSLSRKHYEALAEILRNSKPPIPYKVDGKTFYLGSKSKAIYQSCLSWLNWYSSLYDFAIEHGQNFDSSRFRSATGHDEVQAYVRAFQTWEYEKAKAASARKNQEPEGIPVAEASCDEGT